jgi:hypothetical protein
MASASAASKASRVAWALVVDHGGGDAVRGGKGQAGGIGPVGDHRHHLRRPASAAQRCTMASMLEPRPEIRMTMRFMGGGSDA